MQELETCQECKVQLLKAFICCSITMEMLLGIADSAPRTKAAGEG